MMVIAGIGIISILVLGLFYLIRQSSQLEIARSRAFQAKLLAESGIALGCHPEIFPGDKVLSQKIRPQERFDVLISSEQSRLNINFLLQEANVPILERLLAIWKVPPGKISQLIARLRDWIDPDDLPRVGGAESEDYAAANLPYLPKNRLFSKAEEMRRVHGFEILDHYQPDWEKFFTVHGSGAVDVNEASADVLQAACDIGEMDADRLIEKRSELDTDGRQYRFKSLDEMRVLLGMTPEQFQLIAPRLTIRGNIRRIESTGNCHGFRHQIRTFVRWKGVAPVFTHWENVNVLTNKNE